MKKLLLVSCILFQVFLVLGNSGVSHFYRGTDSKELGLRECVQHTYLSQLGVRELTGNNDGESVEKYLTAVGFPKGNPWCGAFVHWVLTQCVPSELLYGPNQLMSTAKAYAWTPNFVAKPAFITTSPKPGDMITIYYASKGRVGHVGFVDYWTPGNQVVTVEGNTNDAGSREGDGVYVKYRLKSQVYKTVSIFRQ